MIFPGKLIHQLRRQGGKILIPQADHQKGAGKKIADRAVLIPQNPIPGLAFQLSLFVKDDGYRLGKGINGLNASADFPLQRFQPRCDLLFIRTLTGLYHQNPEGLLIHLIVFHGFLHFPNQFVLGHRQVVPTKIDDCSHQLLRNDETFFLRQQVEPRLKIVIIQAFNDLVPFLGEISNASFVHDVSSCRFDFVYE